MLKDAVKDALLRGRITIETDDYDTKALLRSGPGIFVANIAVPGFDEWILLSTLSKVFENVQILYPYPFLPPKGLKPFLFRHKSGVLPQTSFYKYIGKPVSEGIPLGVVIDFSDNPLPSPGKNLSSGEVLRQLRKSKLPIIPVHIVTDKPVFNPLLRRTLTSFSLMGEAAPVTVRVRIGTPISPGEIAAFEKRRDWVRYLQAKIFALGTAIEIDPSMISREGNADMEPLAEPTASDLVEGDITGLSAAHKITSRGPFDVFVAGFSEIPHAMFEIGRLRELTFRVVGEGTGKKRDIDAFDIYYLQLIIWDREKKQIAGGYRLGLGDHIFKKFGVNGFYTHSLFKLGKGIFPVLQEAVELGRSYVTPEYQRHRLSLFLLWKGIHTFMVANPQYKYLYGPVSISKHYSEISKGVIVEFVKRYFFDTEMARHVKPRKSFRVKNKSVDIQVLTDALNGKFDALEHFVEDIEPWHLGVPVLFRQYLRQNARFIAFNVDPLFSDCLDGLMMLDVQHLPESTQDMLR